MNIAPLAAAVHKWVGNQSYSEHMMGQTVLCDYPGCVSWGDCEHSKPHVWNRDCSACAHDLNQTCQPVKGER